MRSLAGAMFLVVLSACASPPPVAPIGFSGPRGVMGEPVIRARVNGHDAFFFVDTGADTHVITGTYARSIGLAPDRVIETVPFASVDVLLPNAWRLPQREIAVFDFPGRMGVESNGFAGVLSPQLLAHDDVDVIVDVGKKRLTLAPKSDRARMPGMHLPLTTCTPTTQAPSRNYTLRAMIEGHPFAMTIDTGRATTALFYERVSDALHIWSPGDDFDAEMQLPDVREEHALVASGKFVLATDHFAPDKACVSDGLLALDVLHQCVLALGVRDGVAACDPRAGR